MPSTGFRLRGRVLGLLLGLWFVVLAPAPAQAQQCWLPGVFGLDFGTVTGAGQSSVATVPFTCTPDYSGASTYYYELCIYLGPGEFSVGQPTRRLSNYNGSYLSYDLFADAAHTRKIGDVGSSPVLRVAGAVPLSEGQRTVHIPIYGWVYPGQAVPVGNTYQEYGISGTALGRFSTMAEVGSLDCASGGMGGGSLQFGTAGVQATYDNSCTTVVSDLDFGAVDAPHEPVNALGNIRVLCPPATVWKVGLDNGVNHDGIMRRMAGPAGYVQYQLYLDESRSQIWGNTEGAMVAGTTDASGNAVSLTVYGQVPAQPEAQIGDYVDTIVVTLYY